MKSSLKRRFLNTITKHKMLNKGDCVLISLSGGIDSTVMTYLFDEIRAEYGLTLYAFHLNHLLRPKEAEAEAEFVARLCDELKIEAFIKECDVWGYSARCGLSLQAAARNIRYELMNEIKSEHGITKIATAHNAGDRVETVLMRLIRGTAGAHISGIAPVRDMCIIRPMLDIFRTDIVEYARGRGIAFMTDSSNAKTVYMRNQVRLELLPHIRDNYNSNIDMSILNFARAARAEEEYIARKAD